MLSVSSHPTRVRERVAPILATAAQVTFVELLFVSPLRGAWFTSVHPVAHVFGLYTDWRLFFSDLFLLLTLAFWFLSLVAFPRPVRLGPWFLTVPIALLVALSCIGIPTGVDPMLTAYHSMRFMLLFWLYLFLINERIRPEWIALLLGLAVVYQTSVAIAQYIAQRSVGLAWLGEVALDPRLDGTSIVRLGDVRVLRAYGLTEHPNVLGGFLAVGMVLLLGYYLSRPGSGSALSRYVWLLPLAVGAVGLLLTFSRAAALAFLAGALFLGLALLTNASARVRSLRDLIIAGAFVTAILALPAFSAQPLLAQRTGQNSAFVDNTGEQRSLAERGALLDSSLRILAQHAVTGVGNGALPVAMSREDTQFDKEYPYQPAHLVIVDVAAELGVAGGLLWLVLLVAPWLALVARWRTVIASPWLLALAAALLVVAVLGLFDYYPWLLEPGRLWQWSAWGLFANVYQSTVNGQAGRAAPTG